MSYSPAHFRPSSSARKHIHYSVKKGANFSTEVKQLETDLTEDMLVSYVQLTLSQRASLYGVRADVAVGHGKTPRSSSTTSPRLVNRPMEELSTRS